MSAQTVLNGPPVASPGPIDLTHSTGSEASSSSPPLQHRQQSRHSSSSETGDCDIIPPSHPARTLVLCFDGTGDQFDTDNSNVVKFFSLLKKDDRNEQMCYYQAGIGTYTGHGGTFPLMAKVDKLLDEMVAWNLSTHVMDGYEFLMQNYQAGDKICLFGFSRGAYTARALAGMIHKVGLLPACNHQQVHFAYKMFARDDEAGWKQSTYFKKAFSIDVDIDFIGVWQVVYEPALYQHITDAAVRGTQPGDMPKSDTVLGTREGWDKLKKGNFKVKKRSQHESEFDAENTHWDAESHGSTDVKEVWFAGCHCDIGGGSVADDTPHTLARIPLRWMIRECFKKDTGIRFHAELLKDIGLDPASLHPIVKERPSALQPDTPHFDTVVGPAPEVTEEEHEVRDALSPIYDQLALAPYWWLLEFLPMRTRYQGPPPDRKMHKSIGPNLGRGRHVPKHHTPFFVHRSVLTRMQAKGLKSGPYQPRAAPWTEREPIWVD
ncbi:hypothetical protein GSI_05977 [Ganoderma sinense ZZ0214-1]|uniref:T6SS Phospholipase effector Tle1-like catalytic domain-containing protein n=1 Tax=Ganoderma sinense ZZ0214-1 TaxID=1077348 RepID=A0A2G8SBZ6_9APHY|nr:hypothetical protein GSI_05977 [Ganoderma sinense ZZ0214-1]